MECFPASPDLVCPCLAINSKPDRLGCQSVNISSAFPCPKSVDQGVSWREGMGRVPVQKCNTCKMSSVQLACSPVTPEASGCAYPTSSGSFDFGKCNCSPVFLAFKWVTYRSCKSAPVSDGAKHKQISEALQDSLCFESMVKAAEFYLIWFIHLDDVTT